MKKLIVTLDINNYTKEITDITYPYMKSYADKIGADFKIITERKYPNEPVICEKFQVYNISKNYDWTILIDCDAIIHPNCPDLTEIYEKDTVLLNGYDLYPLRFKHNNYTKRDGRNIGACPWVTVFSDWTRHLWEPYENARSYINQINLLHLEKNFGYSPEHILTDYFVSLNIAKYGLKVKTILFDIFNNHPNITFQPFLIHQYCITQKEKIEYLRDRDNLIKNDKYTNHINFNKSKLLENIKYS
jgi:hypothetical protein